MTHILFYKKSVDKKTRVEKIASIWISKHACWFIWFTPKLNIKVVSLFRLLYCMLTSPDVIILYTFLKPFHTNVSFLYPPENSEKPGFSNVFRGFGNGNWREMIRLKLQGSKQFLFYFISIALHNVIL